MRRTHLPLLFVLAVLSLAPRAASAVTCAETLAGKFTKFTQARMRIMHHCRELVLTGRRPGPCPDYRATLQVEKARAKLRTVVNRQCGGPDETCGAGGDDADLVSLGWNVGQCPNVHGGSCTGPIDHCGDIAECLICVGETATDDALSLVYDSLEDFPPVYEVYRCQSSITGSMARYFDAKSSALATCEQRDLDDLVAGTCPDPVKTAPRIARAEEKLSTRVCTSCGSTDDVCGGDDLPPEWIGFPSSCPAVTPPGGSSCAGPVDQLSDLVECVRCVTDFHVACLDALAVPTLKSYPGQCQ